MKKNFQIEDNQPDSLNTQEQKDYDTGSFFENTCVEKNIKELFDLFESVLFTQKKGYSVSRTIFESDYIFEIEKNNKFLRLVFEFEQLELPKSCDNIEAVVNLDYTSKDVKPIRGKVIDSKRFQGVVEHFYLLDGSWYLLNPREFSKIMPLEDFLVTEYSIKNRIIEDVFGTD